MPQWQLQSYSIRSQLPADVRHSSPWSSAGFSLPGLKKVPRILEVLDLAVLGYLGEQLRPNMSMRDMQEQCSELFTDVSQNPARRSYTHRAQDQSNVSKCLTTSTVLYTHGRDRLVLPQELLYFQGHSLDVRVPPGMKASALRDLAGEGICLPCLATLIYALHHTDSLTV